MLENSYYRDLYDRKISTPVFHTIGVWDATVSAAQTTALAHQCLFPVVFHFEGGHYVPQAKEFVKLDIVLREFLQTIPYFLPNDWWLCLLVYARIISLTLMLPHLPRFRIALRLSQDNFQWFLAYLSHIKMAWHDNKTLEHFPSSKRTPNLVASAFGTKTNSSVIQVTVWMPYSCLNCPLPNRSSSSIDREDSQLSDWDEMSSYLWWS